MLIARLVHAQGRDSIRVALRRSLEVAMLIEFDGRDGLHGNG